MGAYIKLVEIPEGWGGGVTFVFKKWKFRGGGGDLHEIPSVVEVWIISGTTHLEAKLFYKMQPYHVQSTPSSECNSKKMFGCH